MNGLTLVILTACVYALAYRFYGAFIASKVLMLNSDRITPANKFNNNYDYIPTNKWVTFGHHFSAIAGAGPLVGPALAAQFGYLPGFLWILIGAVLAGGVHDIVVLFSSVRADGLSLMEIAKRNVGKLASVISAIAIFIILIITVAGLAIVVVNALYKSSWGTFTVFATIIIAIFMGIYTKYIRYGDVIGATVFGGILLILSVLIGPYLQHSHIAGYFLYNQKELTVLLGSYGFIAAVLPIWLLLVPRGYLSTYLKLGVILLLAIGVIVVNPHIRMPAITAYVHGNGPIISGKVWPFLFITIACGALSGFHSIISSGTTPKIIKNEKDILLIGYGAMLAEGFVAVMALIAATSLIPADYFAINVPKELFISLGMNVEELPYLSHMVGEDVAGRPGGAVSLAVGMAYIFSKIPFLTHLMSYLYHFAILFEALFILTTVDAGTRIGRYILQEAGGIFYKSLKNKEWWPGIIVCSALFSLAWSFLVYDGTISTIWPLFGTANQLLSAIALLIGTNVLIKMNKTKYIYITLVPFVFVIITTLAACYLNIVDKYIPAKQYVLIILTIIIMILSILIVFDSIFKWLMGSIKFNKD
jgi:carbon starvation protein